MASKLATTGEVTTSSTNGDRNDEELMSELAAGRREAASGRSTSAIPRWFSG